MGTGSSVFEELASALFKLFKLFTLFNPCSSCSQ